MLGNWNEVESLNYLFEIELFQVRLFTGLWPHDRSIGPRHLDVDGKRGEWHPAEVLPSLSDFDQLLLTLWGRHQKEF
jgi:hypothetical protein